MTAWEWTALAGVALVYVTLGLLVVMLAAVEARAERILTSPGRLLLAALAWPVVLGVAVVRAFRGDWPYF